MCKIKFKVYLTKRNVWQLQAPDDTEIYKYQEKIENLTTEKKKGPHRYLSHNKDYVQDLVQSIPY